MSEAVLDYQRQQSPSAAEPQRLGSTLSQAVLPPQVHSPSSRPPYEEERDSVSSLGFDELNASLDTLSSELNSMYRQQHHEALEPPIPQNKTQQQQQQQNHEQHFQQVHQDRRADMSSRTQYANEWRARARELERDSILSSSLPPSGWAKDSAYGGDGAWQPSGVGADAASGALARASELELSSIEAVVANGLAGC